MFVSKWISSQKMIPDYYTPVKPETYQLTSKVFMTVSLFLLRLCKRWI